VGTVALDREWVGGGRKKMNPNPSSGILHLGFMLLRAFVQPTLGGDRVNWIRAVHGSAAPVVSLCSEIHSFVYSFWLKNKFSYHAFR